MDKEEAIKYLQQLYPNGGHCWLDEQRMEAIGMAIDALSHSVTKISNQEEPVSDIEAYQSRWGKSIGFIDYSTSEEIGDYGHKAVMESLHPQLKEEPVSEDFEKIVEEIAEPTILNAYGTKELARRLRNTICGTSISEDLGEYINELSKQFPEVSFAKLSRIAVRVAKWQAEQFEKERLKHCDELTEEQAQMESDFVIQHLKKNNRTPTFIDAIEYGMKMQKQQMMAKAIDGDITFDYYGDDDKTYGCIAHDSFCLEDFGLKDRDKVKMILIKEDKL